MTYTITLIRRITENVGDHLTVLITDDKNEYFKAWHDLTIIFENNKTFVSSKEYVNDNFIKLFIEFDFQKEE